MDVFIADQLEVFSFDLVHGLFVRRLTKRKCSLVLIQRSNGLNEHADVGRAAVALYGLA
jgi:hypothetical protein